MRDLGTARLKRPGGWRTFFRSGFDPLGHVLDVREDAGFHACTRCFGELRGRIKTIVHVIVMRRTELAQASGHDVLIRQQEAFRRHE